MPGVNFQQTFTNTDNSMDTSVSFLMPKPKPTFADLTLINTGPSSFLQQERQSLDDPNQRLFPSVRSSQYGQTNKFNNTVHSKILKDFLNQPLPHPKPVCSEILFLRMPLRSQRLTFFTSAKTTPFWMAISAPHLQRHLYFFTRMTHCTDATCLFLWTHGNRLS